MNKTALITGASSGIGYELSKIFAAEGFDLVVVARSQGKLDQLAAELQQAHQRRVTVLLKDLSDPATPEEIFETLHLEGIHIDVLVNSAGFGTHGEFAQSDLDEELAMMQVNMASLVHLTRLFLPGMLKRGYGRILNLGSTGSFAPVPLMAVYGATKAFVLWFSEALKNTPVLVTAMCPGVTRTGFQQRASVSDTRYVAGPAMSAEQVAKAGYEALMRGRAVVVPGFFNQLLPFFVRFLPRPLILRLSHLLMQPAE